jgi:hypothetical protein
MVKIIKIYTYRSQFILKNHHDLRANTYSLFLVSITIFFLLKNFPIESPKAW